MNFPVQNGSELVTADCVYVQPRKIVLPPLNLSEKAELKQDGVADYAIARLEAFRQNGDITKVESVLYGLAESRLQTHSSIERHNRTRYGSFPLQDFGLHELHLHWFLNQLWTAFRVYLTEKEIRSDMRLDELADLVIQRASFMQDGVSDLYNWSKYADNLRQVDAGMYGRLACDKWTASCALGVVAGSLEEIKAAVTKDPRVDVTALLLCEVEPRVSLAVGTKTSSVGMALFHRTWQGNVVLEYLAAHPKTIGSLKGIGMGLLHHVAVAAIELDAESLWMETSESSAGFYSHVLEGSEIRDVSRLSRATLQNFVSTNTELWAQCD